LNNLDLTSVVSFKDYAAQKNPQSNSDKFLVVAAWFKEHRGISAVTAEHVYTCYRHVGWQCVVKPNFSQPFRDLKRQQVISGDAQSGYEIGLIGQGRIDKMPRE
jgi:hypothetical protein